MSIPSETGADGALAQIELVASCCDSHTGVGSHIAIPLIDRHNARVPHARIEEEPVLARQPTGFRVERQNRGFSGLDAGFASAGR